MTESLISTKTFIFNDEGKVLVLRRSETHPRKPHHTDLPGGLVEQGEYELIGMAREVHEETGISLDANICKLFYAHTWIVPSGRSLSMLLYQAHFDHTPDVTISWEHESYEWLSLEALLERQDLEDTERQSIEYAMKNNLFGV